MVENGPSELHGVSVSVSVSVFGGVKEQRKEGYVSSRFVLF